jgi:hypothetical protein
LAPAVEYFGPLKMSVLGIRNEIHDLAIRYDVRADIGHALAKQIMGTALMTEASLNDWQKKYPGDDQLARDVYLLQHLYAKIDFDDARAKAKYCAQWLLSTYPKSWYAKNLRMTMARDGATVPASSPAALTPAPPAAAPPAAAPPSGAAKPSSSGTSGASNGGTPGSGTSGSSTAAGAAATTPSSTGPTLGTTPTSSSSASNAANPAPSLPIPAPQKT